MAKGGAGVLRVERLPASDSYLAHTLARQARLPALLCEPGPAMWHTRFQMKPACVRRMLSLPLGCQPI